MRHVGHGWTSSCLSAALAFPNSQSQPPVIQVKKYGWQSKTPSSHSQCGVLPPKFPASDWSYLDAAGTSSLSWLEQGPARSSSKVLLLAEVRWNSSKRPQGYVSICNSGGTVKMSAHHAKHFLVRTHPRGLKDMHGLVSMSGC